MSFSRGKKRIGSKVNMILLQQDLPNDFLGNPEGFPQVSIERLASIALHFHGKSVVAGGVSQRQQTGQILVMPRLSRFVVTTDCFNIGGRQLPIFREFRADVAMMESENFLLGSPEIQSVSIHFFHGTMEKPRNALDDNCAADIVKHSDSKRNVRLDDAGSPGIGLRE
jgi:hypothetical protein